MGNPGRNVSGKRQFVGWGYFWKPEIQQCVGSKVSTNAEPKMTVAAAAEGGRELTSNRIHTKRGFQCVRSGLSYFKKRKNKILSNGRRNGGKQRRCSANGEEEKSTSRTRYVGELGGYYNPKEAYREFRLVRQNGRTIFWGGGRIKVCCLYPNVVSSMATWGLFFGTRQESSISARNSQECYAFSVFLAPLRIGKRRTPNPEMFASRRVVEARLLRSLI